MREGEVRGDGAWKTLERLVTVCVFVSCLEWCGGGFVSVAGGGLGVAAWQGSSSHMSPTRSSESMANNTIYK